MQSATQDIPGIIAAVDLGSNSFHMIVGQIDNGQLQIVDRMKEMVRLGEGLDQNRRIRPEVAERALACLRRFGERLADLPPQSVRAVGTNTLRQVRDGGAFLQQAHDALGHDIEIIAGREEARLIYLGVAHGLAEDGRKRLVVDIGGGSTELIIGRDMQPRERESLFMGCVSMSQRYFPDGRITKASMDMAVLHARIELRGVRRLFNADHWELAVGASGTIRSIRSIVQAEGWSDAGISKASLKKLRQRLIAAGHIDAVQLNGLTEERRPVFAGGVAVLSGIFKSLGIHEMRVSDLALREGLLYELLGSITQHDSRDRTVDALLKRYGLDLGHARNVASTSLQLYRQVRGEWPFASVDGIRLLKWASLLHEIGLVISHSGHQKHGAYILANADLPGFTRQQQAMLASMVRWHRRKLSSSAFSEFPTEVRKPLLRLCVLLRLSVLLNRGRAAQAAAVPDTRIDDGELLLQFPAEWLQQHPLTSAELEEEAARLQPLGLKLHYRETS
jgi:exopolyphosphatase/guanosine-5'-triphosphate,3'-diphosphate pyrophosphatase